MWTAQRNDIVTSSASCFTVLIFYLLVNTAHVYCYVCDLYIAPSLILGRGVGVFAGRQFNRHEKLPPNHGVSYILKKDDFQVNLYAYHGIFRHIKTNESSLEFGFASVFNHGSLHHVESRLGDVEHTLDIALTYVELFQSIEPYSVYPTTHFDVVRDVFEGEEMLNNYGDNWFSGNNLTQHTHSGRTSYTIDELQERGSCATAVTVKPSAIPDAGVGVFATRGFKSGDVMQVSPVLVLSKGDVVAVSDQTSVLINYCLSRTDSDVALLPINLVGLCNHAGSEANALLDWFFWSDDDDARAPLSADPNELCKANAAGLYLGYRAKRDISEGEEVTIDYGLEWQSAFEDYVEARRVFQRFEEPLPIFRRHIDAPMGLFPHHWMVPCIGSHCDGEYSPDSETDEPIPKSAEDVTSHGGNVRLA